MRTLPVLPPFCNAVHPYWNAVYHFLQTACLNSKFIFLIESIKNNFLAWYSMPNALEIFLGTIFLLMMLSNSIAKIWMSLLLYRFESAPLRWAYQGYLPSFILDIEAYFSVDKEIRAGGIVNIRAPINRTVAKRIPLSHYATRALISGLLACHIVGTLVPP